MEPADKKKCCIRANYIAKLYVFFFLLLFFHSYSFAAFKHDQSLVWKTLRSKHFEVHFHEDAKEVAKKTIRLSEKVFNDLQTTLDWIPTDTIEIILTDEVDFVNGFVMPFLPSLRVTLYITPPDEISDYNDWLELLITHELTHALHLNKAKNTPAQLRKFFGDRKSVV